MRLSFGRPSAKMLPLFAVATLGIATLAHAGPIRQAAGVRPATAPASVAGSKRHVKRNAGSGPIYFAGGATLPAVAYVGATQAVAGQSNPAIVPGAGTTGTVFGYFATTYSPNNGLDTITYCQTGSGFGKSVMNGDNDNLGDSAPTPLPANANLPCPSPVGTKAVAQVNGFGAIDQDFGDFSGSDAPLLTTEFGDWNTNSQTEGRSIYGRGLPVQIPYIIGSVAILYNNDDPAVEAKQLNLSTTQLCKIADGEITNWNQLNKKFQSKTLAFADRSDKSGTSFSFANHLNVVCKGAGETYGVSQNYDEYISGNPAIGALPSPLPPGATHQFFIPGSGNGGVVANIENTDGGVGYVETANALTAVNGSNIQFATIGGRDPVKNLPETAGQVVLKQLLTSEGVGPDVANGRAPLQQLSPSDNCVLIVNPQSYANLAKKNAYPIIAVTNLEFSQKGNGSDAGDLQTLAYMMSQSSPEAVGNGKITTVDVYGKSNVGTTGYSTLNQASFGAVIKQTALTCIGS